MASSSSSISTSIALAPDLRTGSRIRVPLVTDRENFIVSMCRTATMVAHVGCTDSPYTQHRLAAGELLHERLLELSTVVGFDIDEEALTDLRVRFSDAAFICADLSPPVPEACCHRFDLVIVGEVLEHVPDAATFLSGTRELLAVDGSLLVTVPNACSPKIGARSLIGRESVHPDHHTYYGPRTLRHTLECAGYSVDLLATYLATPGPLGHAVNLGLRIVHRVTQGPVGEGLIALAHVP